MTENDPKNMRKWRNILLFPRIQIIYLLITILSLSFFYSIALFQVAQSFNKMKETASYVPGASESHLFRLLEFQQSMIVQNITIAFFLFLIFIIPVVLVVTHRTMGPFYRLKMFFKNFNKDNPSQIKFRDNDYFKELEEDINEAIGTVKKE